MSRSRPLRRAAAGALDGLLCLAAAVPLARTLGYYFAERAVVTLRIGAPDSWWRGPVPLLLSTVGELTYLLPAVAGVLLALTEGVWRRSPGKALLGLEIRARGGAAPGRALRWRRLALKAAPLWGAAAALVAGSSRLLVAAAALGALLLAGCLAALAPSRLALHDRLTGTEVARVPRPPAAKPSLSS